MGVLNLNLGLNDRTGKRRILYAMSPDNTQYCRLITKDGYTIKPKE